MDLLIAIAVNPPEVDDITAVCSHELVDVQILEEFGKRAPVKDFTPVGKENLGINMISFQKEDRRR